MEKILKKLCIENINKNKENYAYSYELKSPLKYNEDQIKVIFENFKFISLHFDFYRLRVDLTIYSKDQQPQYGLDIYLDEQFFKNFYEFTEKELKKDYENKSNLKFNNIFIIKSGL